MTKIPKFTCVIGLPGSEKTKYATQLSKETGAEIFSSGKIRNILRFQNPEIKENEVFSYIFNKIIENLKNGKDCIFDSTNINSKYRALLLKKTLKNVNCEKVCVIMATPYSECISNNYKRGYPIPNKIIDNMYKNWQTPAHFEGWNKIWIHYNNHEWIGMNGTPRDYLHDTFDFVDINKKSLGFYSTKVGNYLREHLTNAGYLRTTKNWNNENLFLGGYLFCCGIPVCAKKDWANAFLNVGAYEALFFKYNKKIDPVYVSNLINHIKEATLWKSTDGSRKKAIIKYGKDFCQDLTDINNAIATVYSGECE